MRSLAARALSARAVAGLLAVCAAGTREQVRDGYRLFLPGNQRKEHGAAVAALTRALDLERERRQLGQPAWRQLIMTLANPMTDVAFGKFKNDTRFRDAVKAMKKQFKK